MPLDTVHVGQYALRFEERELSSSVGCSTNGRRISGSPFLGHKCGGMPQSVVCTAAGLAYSPHPWLLEILQAWEFHPPLVLVQLSCGVGWEWTARPTFQVLPTHLSSFRSSPLWATGSRFLLLPVTLRPGPVCHLAQTPNSEFCSSHLHLGASNLSYMEHLYSLNFLCRNTTHL